MTTATTPKNNRQHEHRILARTRALRRRLHGVSLVRYASLSLIMLVSVCAVSFLVDFQWEPGLATRRPLVAFLAATLLVGLIALISSWLRADLSDDRVAQLIEDANPWLEDSLISAIQLARELDRGDSFHSAELISSVIARSAIDERPLERARAARLGPKLPLLLSALACLGLVFTWFTHPATRDHAHAWRDRLLRLDATARYPQPVTFRLLNPEGDRVQIVRGEDLVVDARIERGSSEGLDIVTRFDSNAKVERRAMARVSEDSFTKSYQNITESFSFEVVDHVYRKVRSRRVTVELVERAQVEEVQFWLEFPEYTALPATPEDQPITRTSLEVPTHTTLRYRVLSTRPVASASLVRLFGAKEERREQGSQPTVTSAGTLAGREITGSFQVFENQGFRFNLIAENGVESDKNSMLYNLRVIEDRPPVVSYLEPGRSKSVTRKALVPMRISARDHYGVDFLEINSRIQRGGGLVEGSAQRSPPPEGATLEGDAKKATYSWTLNVDDRDLLEGDQLEYWAVAYDRNLDETKRAGRSLAYNLTIVSDEDMARLLQDRLARIKGDLEAIAKAQSSTRRETEQAKQKLSLKETLDRDDRRRLVRLESSQQSVSKRLKQVGEELVNLIAERANNQLIDEREDILHKNVYAEVKRLAEQLSPNVAREIRDIVARIAAYDPTRLAMIPDRQQEIEKALWGLVNQLDKWGDLSDVMRDLKELLQAEEKILEDTEKSLKKQNQ
jgi:hypothetical protein